MTRRPGGGPRVYDIRSPRRDGETIPKESAAICAERRPMGVLAEAVDRA